MSELQDAEPVELIVARHISAVSEWGVGRHFGEPTLNDDGSSDEMFDVRFDHAEPPVALEITASVDDQFAAGADAAWSRVENLRRAAVKANYGSWVFSITGGTSVRSVLPVMLDIIALGHAPPDEDLPSGLMSVQHDPDGTPGAEIATWSGPGAAPLRGLGLDLESAITDNAPKLGRAAGYERHLAVDVHALRASDPTRTPIPVVPAEIDFLWVIRRSVSATRTTPVIWITDGQRPWRVNGEPHEAI